MKPNKQKTEHRMSINDMVMQNLIDRLKDKVETIEEYEMLVDDCNQDISNGHLYPSWALDILKLAEQNRQGGGNYKVNKCKIMKDRFITMIEDLERFRKHYIEWNDRMEAPLETLYYRLCMGKEYAKGDR